MLMLDSDARKVTREQSGEAAPWQALPIAASPMRFQPSACASPEFGRITRVCEHFGLRAFWSILDSHILSNFAMARAEPVGMRN
jgi:hypothetical protein